MISVNIIYEKIGFKIYIIIKVAENTLLVANLWSTKDADRFREISMLIHLRNSMRGKFVAISVKILDLTIVRPFVGDVKSSGYWAAIWILSPSLKKIFVVHFIQIVDSIVECYQYHLWYFADGQISYVTNTIYNKHSDI